MSEKYKVNEGGNSLKDLIFHNYACLKKERNVSFYEKEH